MKETLSERKLRKRIKELEKKLSEYETRIEHLKKSEEKYHFLFDNLQETVVIYRVLRNSQGDIIDWILDDCNIMARKELGRPFEEALGKRAIELFGEDMMHGYIDRSKRVDKTRAVESFETYFDFNEKYYVSKVFFISEDLYVNVSEDITIRKRIEKEKEKLWGQLLQSQKMESVGRLAGGVAHDFNNMLSIIIGNTELIMEKIDPFNPFHDSLGEIQNAAERAAAITQQLLAFARKQTIAPKVMNLNEAVESMLKMLKRLISEEISLNWVPAEDLPFIKMDPSQIDQILANLCVNAKDAIDGSGQITIETDAVRFDDAYCADHIGFLPGDFVMLAVSDTGCGMTKEVQDKVFEPFYTTKKMHKGTGLGLATVYGIVKQNKGFINIYSEPFKGTTFKIYFRAHKSAEKESFNKPVAVHEETGDETILLVEDELSILKLGTRMLEGLGYHVLSAETPGKAMLLAKQYAGPIDLLITDVIMPEMNGRELSEKLELIYPQIKCLFMSGYTANVIAHHGVLDEGVHIIQKPFSKKDLASKVRGVLDE